jgi:rhodanese-related sulfurtransferase
MYHMDDIHVAHAELAQVPEAFGDGVVLLDVREHDEWHRGHAAGAHHIPMSDIPSRMAEIDADAALYVICHAGGRSLKVAQYLAGNGYEPINVTGGMLAWAGAGRPIITDGGGPGTV